MSEEIQMDEVLAELARLCAKGDELPLGFTSWDVANARGVTQAEASRRISHMMRAGLARYVGKRRVVNNVGGHSLVPVFILTGKGECLTKPKKKGGGC
jgi:hypothetical protein